MEIAVPTLISLKVEIPLVTFVLDSIDPAVNVPVTLVSPTTLNCSLGVKSVPIPTFLVVTIPILSGTNQASVIAYPTKLLNVLPFPI